MDYAKKYFILGLIATLAFVVGALSTQTTYAQAETSTVNFQSDFEVETVSSCGGESLRLGGTAHFVFHITTTENGKSIQSTTMNYQKVGGVGLESGKKYQLNEVNKSVVVKRSGDTLQDAVIHSLISGTLISQGKDTNTGVTINLLSNFDDDGDVKTTVDKVDFRCNG